MVKYKLTLALSAVFFLLFGSTSYAAPAINQNRGLFLSPATSFVSANAGTSQTGKLTVADYSPKPINVALQVKEFNVNEYTYSYTFNNDSLNWVTFSQDDISLSPNASQEIAYSINIPKGTNPGGKYLTFIASTVLGSGSIKSTAQVASLFYVTVNGKLNHNSMLDSYGMHRIFFGRQIGYHFNVIDTGNVYSFIYESASLHGLFGSTSTTSIAHIIIPNKIKTISGSVEAPKWPGIYRATYGYTTTGGAAHHQAQLILYIPPWSIAILLAILLVINVRLGKRKNTKQVHNDKKE